MPAKPGVTIEIEGVKQLFDRMDAFENKVSRLGTSRALRAGAKAILPEVKERAPVYRGRPNPKTGLPVAGRFRDSLRVKAMRRKKGRVGVRITTSDFDSLFQGQAWYGGFIVFGTKDIEPNRFMHDAYEARKADAITAMEKTLVAEIEAASR